MHEAKERCALLDDTTPATFVRFGQYIYTGDYLAADHVILLGSASIERDQDNRNDEPHEDPQITRSSDPTPRPPTPSTDEVAYQPAAIVDSLEVDPWGTFTRTSSKPKKGCKRGKFVDLNAGDAAVVETAESSTQR
ncbi:hypothetical protein LTR74_018909, partial [Friedmanniomyces endolithicus]